MWKESLLGIALVLPVAGCANLTVTKISEQKRATGEDRHVKGFRYYLSRPYVIVKAPVLVSEHTELYSMVDRSPAPAQLGQLPIPSENSLRAEKFYRVNPASGTFESVTEEELARLKKAIAANSGVQQIGFKRQAPPPSTVVVQPPAAPALPKVADLAGNLADAPGSYTVVGSAIVGAANQSIADKVSGNARAADLLPDVKISADPAGTTRKTVNLAGNIDVVFLPDLDEQYAVHNCNFLSKSAYALNFQDGWALMDVGGNFDSTPVPLEILNFIDTAITAAKNVALAGVDRQARAAGDVALPTTPGAGARLVYQVTVSTYLKPGVYRVNKPWECKAEQTTGCGLLAKMGLATFETTRIEVHPDLRSIAELKQAVKK
jgi:hypothetical protein